MKKKVILLFGEMGSGKTYWGERIVQNDPGLHFVEGDNFVPPEMKVRVASFRFPTRKQLNDLVESLAAVPCAPVDSSCEGWVIAQALYLNSDRETLIEYWTKRGFEVTPVWIKTSFWRNLKQLLRRSNGWKWVVYWLMNKPFFQKPRHDYVPLKS